MGILLRHSPGLYRSRDQGRTWDQVLSADKAPWDKQTQTFMCLSSFKTSGGGLVITTGGMDSSGIWRGQVHVSRDGGGSFSSMQFPATDWGMGPAEATPRGTSIVAIGNLDTAARFDLRSFGSYQIKDAPFTEEWNGDRQGALSYVPGAGWYFVIRPITEVDTMLARYSGKGI